MLLETETQLERGGGMFGLNWEPLLVGCLPGDVELRNDTCRSRSRGSVGVRLFMIRKKKHAKDLD
jgi:hypothetical protein